MNEHALKSRAATQVPVTPTLGQTLKWKYFLSLKQKRHLQKRGLTAHSSKVFQPDMTETLLKGQKTTSSISPFILTSRADSPTGGSHYKSKQNEGEPTPKLCNRLKGIMDSVSIKYGTPKLSDYSARLYKMHTFLYMISAVYYIVRICNYRMHVLHYMMRQCHYIMHALHYMMR